MATAKPVMRHLLKNKTKIDFLFAAGLAVLISGGYKFGVQERRRKLFNDFHATYDAEKDYQRMKSAGVFQIINQAVEEGKMTLD